MYKRCVFRIEVEGSLWRVTEEQHPHVSTMFLYRVMHKRRCYCRVEDWDARQAIVRAMELACGCGVKVNWEGRS